MRYQILVFLTIAFFSCKAEAPRYQFEKDQAGRLMRLDTKTGEITPADAPQATQPASAPPQGTSKTDPFAGSHGPTNQEIKTQISECLNALHRISPDEVEAFPDNFEIQGIQVKDRLLKEGQAKIVATITVRLKESYGSGSGLFAVFKDVIPTPGMAGDIITTDHDYTFERYEKGWRLQC